MIKALQHLPRRGFTEVADPANLKALLAVEHAVLWVDVTDPSPEDMEFLGKQFDFHELALADASLSHQRAKLHEYDQFYFLVFYSLDFTNGNLKATELDLFVGANYVVAVHRGPVREIEEGLRRWEGGSERTNHGAGGLIYSLLDSLVDSYFGVADGIAEQVTALDERVVDGLSQRTVKSVFVLKKHLLAVRRILGPERDALNTLMRQDLPLLDRKTLIYLRDVYDHLVRITDTVDLHSDLLTSALDIHLSAVSNRLNQVMKTLTSVTIILMTMGLVAGTYGMNFAMPEQQWGFGYFWALGLMAAAAAGLYVFLRGKGWL